MNGRIDSPKFRHKNAYLVQLPQVLLLLLVHNNVNTSDGFTDNTNLGQFGSGATGDLGHPQGAQLILEVFQLLGQLILGLVAELGALDLTLENKMKLSKLTNCSG